MNAKRALKVVHIQLLELGLMIYGIVADLLLGNFWVEGFVTTIFFVIGLVWIYISKDKYSLLYLTAYHIITFIIVILPFESDLMLLYSIVAFYKFCVMLLNYSIKITRNDKHIEKIKEFFGFNSTKDEIYNNKKRSRKFSGFQKCILVIYIIIVLWTSIFNVPWVVKPRQDSNFQTRVNSSIFKQPEKAVFTIHSRRDRRDVGYAYIDTKQITIVLFSTTVTCGILFVLTMPKESKKQ